MNIRYAFLAVTALSGVAVPSMASAATFVVDATYDGITVTVNPGSTDPTGLTLTAGDDIVYTLSAISGSGWMTNSPESLFPFLAFPIVEAGTRNVTYSLDFLRSGSSIFNDTGSVANSSVHFGTNRVAFGSGLIADAFQLSVVFDSGDDATIAEITPIFGTPDRNRFAADPSALTFGPLATVGAVPEPATWAFMIFGFGAIGGAMRRQRKMNVKVSYA